jgi:1,4-alpha-glucan branching enzyme
MFNEYRKYEFDMGYLCMILVLRAEIKLNMVQKTFYKTKDYCKVRFSFAVDNAETIEILGLNNDWENAVPMIKRRDGNFTIELNLPKDSRHEFKYLVNATEWLNEPEADAQAPNEFGGSNSILSL